jgi:type IV pilus assembly protein PilE
MKSRSTAGFTLIELMIVVVIVAILASIALPSYESYVRRAKLREATASLADMRIKMEQYYQDNRNYGPAGGNCVPVVSADNFSITCAVGAGGDQTFVATASSLAGRGLGSGAGEYAYTINETNTRVTTMYKNVAQSAKNCWLIRGDEC